MVLGEAVIARHPRCFERDRTCYDWQHYISAVQRKPGALRDGAPFLEMPEPLRRLRALLLRQPDGDRTMARVLATVPQHGLDAVLVAWSRDRRTASTSSTCWLGCSIRNG